MSVRTIGGTLQGGGWIYQSLVTDPVANDSPWTSAYGGGFPIRQCRLNQQYNERPLFIGGLLGCPTTRRVSFQAQFAFTMWFDFDNPIESYYPTGSPPGQLPVMPAQERPSFRQRDPFQLLFLAGVSAFSMIPSEAWFAPRCVADTIAPIWDEESDPRKCIGMEITGHTRGWTFILPEDGRPQDATTLVGAYVAYIRTNPLL